DGGGGLRVGAGPAAAGEGSRYGGTGGVEGPGPGHPVDNDRGGRGGGRGPGERERAEHAAFHAAEPAGQRDEPPGGLADGAGEQEQGCSFRLSRRRLAAGPGSPPWW